MFGHYYAYYLFPLKKQACDWQRILSCRSRTAPVLFLHERGWFLITGLQVFDQNERSALSVPIKTRDWQFFCFFCLFVFSEDFCMPLHDNYTFPPPPIHSLRSFSRKRQSALSSSQPTLLLSVGSISQTSPFRWLYSQCIWKCTSFFFLFLPRWHTSDVAWLWGYRMWSITKRKKKKEKKRSSDSMLDEPAFVWRTNFDDDFTQESTAEQQENNQPLKLLKESFYPSQFWNDFSFTSQEHLWVLETPGALPFSLLSFFFL